MRKRTTQISAMLFAAILAMTGMTNPVSAKAAVQQDKFTPKFTKDHKPAEYKEGEAVVMYFGSSAQGADSKSNKAFGDGITVDKTYDFTPVQTENARSRMGSPAELLVSKVSSKKYSTKQLIEKLNKQQNVQYAEPNYIYKATEKQGKYMPYQWALKNNGQNGGTEGCDINIESAWQKKTGTDKVVAIIDTGVDYTHTDLNTNIWNNPYTDKLKGEHGYDFANNDEDPIDDNGHGSHCAGIIAGNGTGVSGVNQTAKIMALKFLSEDGSGELEGALGAYDYINRAMILGVNVVAVNNSWGGGDDSYILEKVINIVGQKGVITVASAGNNYDDADEWGCAPWNFKSDYLIKVAATNEDDQLANFSNYGKNTIDMGAPGADILSSVCTDTYNPSIHLGEKDYSEIEESFENNKEVNEYKTLTDATNAQMEVTSGEGKGFGAKKNNSLEFKINNAEGEKWYVAYRPVVLPKSSTDYYMSAMAKPSGERSSCDMVVGISKLSDLKTLSMGVLAKDMIGFAGGDVETNYWQMLSGTTNRQEFDADSEYVAWFAVRPYGNTDIDVQIDDVAFSKKDLKPESFGKYAFYNGTSMAGPMVTGAVALISEIKGEMDPKSLREAVVSCVRKTEALEYMTITGGVLDLSKVDTLAPIVRTATADDNTITIKGSCFGKEQGTVEINGKEVTVNSWSNDKIVVTEKENRNKEVIMKVTTKANISAEKKIYVDLNKTDIQSLGTFEQNLSGKVATDGKNFYVLDENSNFASYSKDGGYWNWLTSLDLSVVDKDAVLTDNYRFTYGSQLVYANNGLYTIAENNTGYYNTKALVYYDIENDTWTKAADLPSGLSNAECATLADFQGKLYLVGGYDTKEGKVLNTVYSLEYGKENAAFNKEEATIPARFGAVAHVVGNQLLLTLGGDGTVDKDTTDDTLVPVPNNIVFDGTNWKEIKDSSFTPVHASYYMEKENTGIACYTAQTGVYNGGIIYTDIYTEDMGNVFTYNLKENKYTALPCSLYSYTQDGRALCGTTVGNQFMFLSASDEDSSDLYAFDVKEEEIQVAVEKLKLNKSLVWLKIDETYTLKADLQPAEATNKNLVWESSDPSIASVSDTGEITTHKAGKVSITARTTDGSNLTAKCDVRVLHIHKK